MIESSRNVYSLYTKIGALQLLGGLAFFVRTKVGALVLGPAGVGVVSLVEQFVQLILQLSAFAIPFAAIKILSKAHSESAEAFKAVYAVLLRLLLILGGIGAAVGIVLVIFQPGWVRTPITAYSPLVAIGLLAVPAMILHGFFRNVPAAAMQPMTSALWDTITAGVMATTVTVGILFFREVGYFVGMLTGAVTVSASYYLYFARCFGLSMTRPVGSAYSLVKNNLPFVKLSFTSYLLAFVTPLALLVVRTTVLEHLGEATAGFLQALIGISLAINLLLNPLNGLLLTPLVNRKIPEGEKQLNAATFHKKLLLAVAIVSLPVILFPDVAVIVLYSLQFQEAAHVLYWFVLSQAMQQVVGVYLALMIGLDLLIAYGAVMVVAPIANAALAIVLVPRLGLAGAGIAALGSTTLLTLGTLGYLHIWNGFRFDRVCGLGTLLLFGSLAVEGAFVGTRPSLDIFNFLAKLLVGIATLVLMLPISLDQDERLALADQLGGARVLGFVGYRRQGEHRIGKRKDRL